MTENKKPFAPKYATTSEYLFDLAKWYAAQDRLPEPNEVSSDFRYPHEVEAFRDRVFALMIGSEVEIKAGYWITNLDGSNPNKLEGNYSQALEQALALSRNQPNVVLRLTRQYIHELKTISERIGLVLEGEFYAIRRV